MDVHNFLSDILPHFFRVFHNFIKSHKILLHAEKTDILAEIVGRKEAEKQDKGSKEGN